MAQRIGISEIAEEAGVSVATVSLALRDKGRMSVETRERIKRIAARHGYVPNAAARTLTSGRSNLIAISIPLSADVPEVVGSVQYFFRLLGAAAARALELEFGLLISAPGGTPGTSEFDGAIVIDPFAGDPMIAACERIGVPVVTVGRPVDPVSPGEAPIRVVDNDIFAATGTMLNHLESRGSRSIALLACEPVDSFQRDSIDAYEELCSARGLDSQVFMAESGDPGHAAEAAARIFAGGAGVDAVYATIDTLARAVLDRAAREGIEVPGELRVATCSDSDLARTASPPLTTIDEKPDRLGESAVELLVAAVIDPDSAPRSLEVETELLARASTA